MRYRTFWVLVMAVVAVTWWVVGATFWFSDSEPRRRDRAVDRTVVPESELVTSAALPVDMGPAWTQLDNPARDGWDTEVFSQRAGEVLSRVGRTLIGDERPTAAALAPWVAGDFACAEIVPASLETVFQDAQVEVKRGRALADATQDPGALQGPAALAAALQPLWEPLRGAEDRRFKFKLFRVRPEPDGVVTTTQFFALSGRTPDGVLEQNATWSIRWRRGDADHPLRLLNIRIQAFEQVRGRTPGYWLEDCTRSALAGNPCYERQFSRGMNHWFQRLQGTRYYAMLGTPALAVADVNQDGRDDLYVGQEMGLPNRLFLQQPDGTLEDVSQAWGADWLNEARGVLLVDLDNDGDQDLAVATIGNVVVAENAGNRFELRTVVPTDDDTMSLSAADADRDGDLDLYVCVYFQNDDLAKPRAAALGAAVGASEGNNEAGRNSLLRNDISGTEWVFRDATAALGLDADNHRHSFASAWEDFDNDGDLDLYVANDYGRNNLYRNDGRRFKEVAADVDAADRAFGMSVSWGDYDRDGWTDVYIGNMFSAAGGRVTHLDRFQPGDETRKREIQRYARGNTLLRNQEGRFSDVSQTAGVTVGRWSWSSQFADLNNDGLLDLAVGNGFITTEDSGDL